MLALGVDTSEPLGGVALYDGRGLADERWMDEPLRHAEQLFPLIETILGGNGMTRDRLRLVCINRGPGSFTGLRIGLAAAKGFCQAAGAALVGIDGADVYRARVGDDRRTWVIVASRRNRYYVQSFGGARARGPMRMMCEAELVEALRSEQRETTLVGSGAPRVGEALRDRPTIRVAPDALNRPSPLSVAKLGWSEKPADRLFEVEPLYVEPLLA